MRGFFFLLLLSNLLFLAWQYSMPEEREVTAIYPHETTANRGLEPIAELAPDDRPPMREGESTQPEAATVKEFEDGPPPESVQAEAGGTVSSRLCARISGIENTAQRDEVAERLRQSGARIKGYGSQQLERDSYWVLLPPYRSQEKAAEAAAILKRKGISDFFIVRSGEQENAVSLGVFSTRERAEVRREQINALKARLRGAEITLRKRPVTEHWIAYEVADEATLQRASQRLNQRDKENIEEMRCQ